MITSRIRMQPESHKSKCGVQITPVILAGGRGRRLWPLTTVLKPKPFLKLFSKHSLLQKTILRVRGFDDPVIVTERAYAAYLGNALDGNSCQPKSVIYEPVGRNTGPAILAAAFVLRHENPLMLVMPSDHVIGDDGQFRRQVQAIAEDHARGSITVLGISPRCANPHLGYIVPGDGEAGVLSSVAAFVEKPDIARAERLIAERGALWHSGMFLCHAQDLCVMAEELAPEMYGAARDAVPDIAGRAQPEVFLDENTYVNIPSISIDYTILEKAVNRFVGVLNVKWCDIGTWRGMVRALFKVR